MAIQTKTDLLALVKELTVRNSTLQDRLTGQCKRTEDVSRELRAKVIKLKFVARHYKRERDRVDGYLSGILDANNPEQEIPLERDTAAVVMSDVEVVRHSVGNRPPLLSPLGYEDDVCGSIGNDRIAWEDI